MVGLTPLQKTELTIGLALALIKGKASSKGLETSTFGMPVQTTTKITEILSNYESLLSNSTSRADWFALPELLFNFCLLSNSETTQTTPYHRLQKLSFSQSDLEQSVPLTAHITNHLTQSIDSSSRVVIPFARVLEVLRHILVVADSGVPAAHDNECLSDLQIICLKAMHNAVMYVCRRRGGIRLPEDIDLAERLADVMLLLSAGFRRLGGPAATQHTQEWMLSAALEGMAVGAAAPMVSAVYCNAT
jgi:hypothetical protein